MTEDHKIGAYGIREQNKIIATEDTHIEELKNLGYTIVKSGFSDKKKQDIEQAFEDARTEQENKHGLDYLKSIDEHRLIRCPLQYNPIFIEILNHPLIAAICQSLIGPFVILNQQNGIINPPNKEKYSQGSYHRDLPYQHFTSSHPLAINALYCIEDFTTENGSTFVLPASHKEEKFPSDQFIQKHQRQVEAKAGDFIVLDCMLYHSGGVNKTDQQRRAINNVYTIPMMKQQINLPNILAGLYKDDPVLEKLLGYTTNVPNSIQDYYDTRQKK